MSGLHIVADNIWRLVVTLAATLLLAGCVYFTSWNDVMKGWVGHPIAEIVKLEGPPDAITPLSDGNKEYKYWLKKVDPSCIHYWIVNPQGVITGFHYEGRCRPIG